MYVGPAIKAGAVALGAALALATAPVAAAAPHAAGVAARAKSAAKVTVSVRGRTRTLLAKRTVRPRSGWITRGGAPRGKCPADSAQGALNVATRGHWKGSWYSSYHEYYITGILGDNETSKRYYWGLYVNGKLASKGACDIKLKPGERLLFKVTKA